MMSTFVFLDIETTGLIRPNITELAMWPIIRSAFLSTNVYNHRTVTKFSMLFNPDKFIDPIASNITGLYNDMLEDFNKFDENAGKAIISYLSHYPKPICLVAHNGSSFDFVIIKKSFEKIGLTMPDYIFCSDSLKIFKHLDEIEERRNLEEAQRQIENCPPPITEKSVDEFESFINDEALNELFDDTNSRIKERQRLNETTPRRNPQQKFNRKYTGTGSINSGGDSGNSTSKARKELFPEVVHNGKILKKPRKSFKLGDIYERVFGIKPPIAHTSEADVDTLYQIAIKYGDDFIEHADKCAVPFAQIGVKK